MTKPSYTSNSIAPTESAAEWYDRVTERGVTIDTASLRKWADAGDEGAREALYDEHLARRAEEVRGLIRGTAIYLAEMRDHPYRWDSIEYDRYADYLGDLKEELALLEEQAN